MKTHLTHEPKQTPKQASPTQTQQTNVNKNKLNIIPKQSIRQPSIIKNKLKNTKYLNNTKQTK